MTLDNSKVYRVRELDKAISDSNNSFYYGGLYVKLGHRVDSMQSCDVLGSESTSIILQSNEIEICEVAESINDYKKASSFTVGDKIKIINPSNKTFLSFQLKYIDLVGTIKAINYNASKVIVFFPSANKSCWFYSDMITYTNESFDPEINVLESIDKLSKSLISKLSNRVTYSFVKDTEGYEIILKVENNINKENK